MLATELEVSAPGTVTQLGFGWRACVHWNCRAPSPGPHHRPQFSEVKPHLGTSGLDDTLHLHSSPTLYFHAFTVIPSQHTKV